MLYFYY